ncbi:hypothetical protein D3C87_32120 [compost metagenome]
MFKTIFAYKILIKPKLVFWSFFCIFLFAPFVTSMFVYSIKKELQDALLTILSIIFPLIAGFLTFGRDTLKNLKQSIKGIKEKDEKDEGEPTTASDKKKIGFLKDLSESFVDVVLSTFFGSFTLIIILLVAKFNNYEFYTQKFCLPFQEYLSLNILAWLLKALFFYFAYVMFLNTLYLTVFIIRITKDDDIIK